MLAGTLLAGSFVASSAFAQNNNTGQIVVQGVVPGTWEITVEDINSGYDFDLSDVSAPLVARVGTIHVYTNDISQALGHLRIESANSGRLINNEAMPGIAGEHQVYTFALIENDISTNGLTLETGSALPTAHDLVVPYSATFDGSATIAEGTYDIEITIPGTTDRPQASGVYSDTITITIMDDGDDS